MGSAAFVICLLGAMFVTETIAQRRVCRISPRKQDISFKDDFICHEKDAYPGLLVKGALSAELGFQDFVTDTGNCHVDDKISNVHYSTSIYYWNVCATKIEYLTRIWMGTGVHREICHVVEPQKIYYGTCLARRCQLGYASIPNYYCAPSAFIRRRFAVYCTKSRVLKYYTARLPTSCCCKGFKCGLGF